MTFYFSVSPWEIGDVRKKQTAFVPSRLVLAKFQGDLCQVFPATLGAYVGLTNLPLRADVGVIAYQLTEMFSFSDCVTKTTVPLCSLMQIRFF